MLKQRIQTAIILVFIVAAAIFILSDTHFQIFLALVIAIAAWEWSALAGIVKPVLRILYALTSLLILFFCRELPTSLLNQLLWISIIWWLLATACIYSFPSYSKLWGHVSFLSIAGLFVLVPGWLGIIYLRSLEQFPLFIILLFALVAAADIGAYFSGKAFGQHKLAVRVSPNKTWEGFFGGLIACCIVAALVGLYYHFSYKPLALMQWLRLILAATLLSTISVVGDLFESMIKRYRNVKDSGTILPGHGGILDRIDGITSAAPLYALFLLNGLI